MSSSRPSTHEHGPTLATTPSRFARWGAKRAGLVSAVSLIALALPASAMAAQPPVGLGTADSFAVLAGSTATNTGPSVINGDLGVSPGSADTGFTGAPNGTVNGTIHTGDSVAAGAQSALTNAIADAAGRNPRTAVAADLGGQTLTPGVYNGPTLGLTGALTLNAQGDPNVFGTTHSHPEASCHGAPRTPSTASCRWRSRFRGIHSSPASGSSARLIVRAGIVGI